MITLHIEGNNWIDIREKLAGMFDAPVATSDAPPAEQPKRTRKPKAETVEPAATPPTAQQAPVEQKAVDPQPAASTVEALFGGAQQQTPAPVEAPKATQKELIATFRALAETKGTNPVVEIVSKYGAKSVALIPESKWGEAIGLAQAATK